MDNFNKKMQKLKYAFREVKKDLFFHQDAETWNNRKKIKQFNRVRKYRSNVRRKLKKLGLLGAFEIHVFRKKGKYNLHLKRKNSKYSSSNLSEILKSK